MYKHTYNTKPSEGQKFSAPSQTIQGQTLSISEMLTRIQNGMPVTLHSMPYGEDEVPQIRIKDLTDIDDISYQVSETQRKLDEAKKAYDNKQKGIQAELTATKTQVSENEAKPS